MECKRCGDCCRKGGPALHQEDKHLVVSGVIKRRNLFTLRRGEPAWDHAKGVLAPLAEEIVKIRGIGSEWTCMFWNPESGLCGIYNDRPAECRALDCWDTAALEAMYETGRLTRADLISTESALWEILAEHGERCSPERLSANVEAWKQGDQDAGRRLLEDLAYDDAMRDLLVERAGADPDEMEFLFGRPLSQLLAGHRVKARKWGDTYKLVNLDASSTPKEGA